MRQQSAEVILFTVSGAVLSPRPERDHHDSDVVLGAKRLRLVHQTVDGLTGRGAAADHADRLIVTHRKTKTVRREQEKRILAMLHLEGFNTCMSFIDR